MCSSTMYSFLWLLLFNIFTYMRFIWICVCSGGMFITIAVSWSFWYLSLGAHMHSFLLCTCPGMARLGSKISVSSSWVHVVKLTSREIVPHCIWISSVWERSLDHILAKSWWFQPFPLWSCCCVCGLGLISWWFDFIFQWLIMRLSSL